MENLTHIVRSLPSGSIWQAIAVGRFNVDLAAVAMVMGGNVRTGMEDNVYLRRGELAPSNAALVERVADIAAALNRPIATVEHTEAALGLAQRPRFQSQPWIGSTSVTIEF